MKALSIGAIAGVMLATPAPAMAQDFGYGDAYDWSGVYFGATAGYSQVDSNAKFIPSSPYISFPIHTSPEGMSGGLHGGYNFQTGRIVFGAEGDITVGNISTTVPDPLIAAGLPAGNTITAGSDIQLSLRGRFGVAVGNFLPYVTAGLVAAHLNTSATNSVALPLHDSGYGYGWGAGAGVELAVADNWSVRAEYLHTNMQAPNFYVGENYENEANPISDSIRVGVSYHPRD